MMPAPLAIVCLALPSAFFALVFVAGFVGLRLERAEFSWPRYAAFLAVALGGAVLLVAARTTWVFLVVSGVLILWVLLRAALDAQVTTIRERVGFLQLYAALSLVEYSALTRTGALFGTRASPWFSEVLGDHLAHLVLPVASLFRSATRTPPWASPSVLVDAAAATLAGHLVQVLALATFALAAFVYAHFAEHATPKLGLSLLPFPTPAAVLFAVLWAVSRVGGSSFVVRLSTYAALFLTPYFVAEGLWVFQRLFARLRTRTAWAGLLGALSFISPFLAFVLAFLGWAFHLVRLRAFEPILGDVERSASRPRLRTALLASVASSVLFSALAIADAGFLRKLSPGMEIGPDACNGVTFTAGPDGVVVTTPSSRFTIDADETPASGSTAASFAAACHARGERLCTSDEWTLACVCTYPNESEGGVKIGTNDRLAFRLETDRREPTPLDVQRLLSGASEVVSPSAAGAILVAGPSDAVVDEWTLDCRTRGLVTPEALARGSASAAVRCCK